MRHKNARLWVYHNGDYVKLTLRPGQTLSAVEGGPTDEGYDVTYTTWEHDGDVVRMEWHRDARDCDGRMSTGGESVCPLDRLADREPVCNPVSPTPIRTPDWEKPSRYQRDYQAEAAGY